MRVHIDNRNVPYSILPSRFENESVGSCKTLYEVLINVILLTQIGQNELENPRAIHSYQTPSKTLRNSLDFKLHESMPHHMEFIVPLCLKSIILRHCNYTSGVSTKVCLEKCDFDLIEAFTRHLVRCLIYLCKDSSAENNRETILLNALQSSQIVLDFIVGLSSIIQAKQVEVLVSLYFQMLRDHEMISLQQYTQTEKTAQNEGICHQVRCSQQLRLLAAEILSTIPSFLVLNVPIKYSTTNKLETRNEATAWLTHYVGKMQMKPPVLERSNETVDYGWLSDLMLTECFAICSSACHLLVEESIALLEAPGPDRRTNKSSVRMYPESALGKLDLEAVHGTAFHAISIIYELLIRRHSMDQRFQFESAQGRMAGLLTKTILNQTCDNVRWLAKLDCSNQVRSTWLLCFIHVLQEAPESHIYDFIRSCFVNVRCFDKHMPNLTILLTRFDRFSF
jgi:hypothetical protein